MTKLLDSAGRKNVNLAPRDTYGKPSSPIAAPRTHVNASERETYDGKELRPYTGRAGADHSHIKSFGQGC